MIFSADASHQIILKEENIMFGKKEVSSNKALIEALKRLNPNVAFDWFIAFPIFSIFSIFPSEDCNLTVLEVWLLIFGKKINPVILTAVRLQDLYGASDRNWTNDLLITSQLLYQLSYTGKLVTRGRVELPTPPWKGDVLTDWPSGHKINNGEPSQIRTADNLIKSQVLCQLS